MLVRTRDLLNFAKVVEGELFRSSGGVRLWGAWKQGKLYFMNWNGDIWVEFPGSIKGKGKTLFVALDVGYLVKVLRRIKEEEIDVSLYENNSGCGMTIQTGKVDYEIKGFCGEKDEVPIAKVIETIKLSASGGFAWVSDEEVERLAWLYRIGKAVKLWRTYGFYVWAGNGFVAHSNRYVLLGARFGKSCGYNIPFFINTILGRDELTAWEVLYHDEEGIMIVRNERGATFCIRDKVDGTRYADFPTSFMESLFKDMEKANPQVYIGPRMVEGIKRVKILDSDIIGIEGVGDALWFESVNLSGDMAGKGWGRVKVELSEGLSRWVKTAFDAQLLSSLMKEFGEGVMHFIDAGGAQSGGGVVFETINKDRFAVLMGYRVDSESWGGKEVREAMQREEG